MKDLFRLEEKPIDFPTDYHSIIERHRRVFRLHHAQDNVSG